MSRVFFCDRDLGTTFPGVLKAAGLKVELHRDHFDPTVRDEAWLADIGLRGWVALTRDGRIRYKPNELAAVVRHNVSLLVLVGKARHSELAAAFVSTIPRIESFLLQHAPPFIGKVYRPAPAELKRNPLAPGRVDLWYPKS